VEAVGSGASRSKQDNIMSDRRKTLWLPLGAFLICLPALACAGAMLTTCGGRLTAPSGTVTDRIYSPGERCDFPLNVEQPGSITVRMSHVSGDLDPYLRLLDDTDALLVEDDDGGGDSNALIDGFRLERPGTYRIVAGSYGDNATGEFELVVDLTADLP
jgi:hypothetical protein